MKKFITWDQQVCAAAIAAILGDQNRKIRLANPSDPFTRESGIRFNHLLSKNIELMLGDTKIDAKVTLCGGDEYIVSIGKNNHSVSAKMNQVPCKVLPGLRF